MLTRLTRTVALTMRRDMATYRKTREPYSLAKKPPTRSSSPTRAQTEPHNYASVDNPTSFGLRPPEKEPWKPDDDRLDTSKAREVDKPVGGARRQHLVVRPANKDGETNGATPDTKATPESNSQSECKALPWIPP
jgi:hypothetical protein